MAPPRPEDCREKLDQPPSSLDRLGPKFGPKQPGTSRNGAGKDSTLMARKLLGNNTFRHKA
jgi:hypothetical protein